MEGIIKVSRITAEAICTLSVQDFIFGERLADEGEGEQTAHDMLTEMKANRILDTTHYTYLYMPDIGGKITVIKPTPKPSTPTPLKTASTWA